MDPHAEPYKTADCDQALATLKSIAPVLGGYMGALLDEGFERAEAFTFVRDYHAEMLESWRLRGMQQADDD
jgi:hypothetical protein